MKDTHQAIFRFIMILMSLLFMIKGYGQIPTTTVHYVYVGQPEFTSNLGKSGSVSHDSGSYKVGRITYDCDEPEPHSSTYTTKFSCGTVSTVYSSRTNTIIASNSEGSSESFSYDTFRPAFNGANMFASQNYCPDDGSCKEIEDFDERSDCIDDKDKISVYHFGSCSRRFSALSSTAGVDLRIHTLSFDAEISSIRVCQNDDPINLYTLDYWSRLINLTFLTVFFQAAYCMSLWLKYFLTLF